MDDHDLWMAFFSDPEFEAKHGLGYDTVQRVTDGRRFRDREELLAAQKAEPSTLVLWLIYVSYLVLRRFSTSGQTPVLAAALAVFGALDVPLVYFSIWIFRTQHPQPVIGGGGSIDPRMLHVLLINWLAFLCFAFLVCWSRYQVERMQREVEETQALEALLEPGGNVR